MFFKRKTPAQIELEELCKRIAFELEIMPNTFIKGGLASHQHAIPSHMHTIQSPVGGNIILSGGGLIDDYEMEPCVSTKDATAYVEMIDKKIAALIKTRINASKEEKESITISIRTLEMVRDLARHTFIERR